MEERRNYLEDLIADDEFERAFKGSRVGASLGTPSRAGAPRAPAAAERGLAAGTLAAAERGTHWARIYFVFQFVFSKPSERDLPGRPC